MENTGDLLYIIAAIVATIIGVIGSKKKKNQPSEVLGPPIPPPEEWLPESPSQTKTSTPKKKKSKSKITELSPLYSFGNNTQSSENNLTEEQENNQPEISAETLQDTNEARKAIIYSEIFTRKY